MSKRDASLLLQDMRESMQKIARYVAGIDQAAFLADEKTVDAVVRNVEIIGEASKQVPDEFKARHPQVPWKQMAACATASCTTTPVWTWNWYGLW